MEYYEQLSKLDNVNEMEIFLIRHKLSVTICNLCQLDKALVSAHLVNHQLKVYFGCD